MFFGRKPAAPAFSPAKAYSSRSKVVRMSTRERGQSLTMRRVASIPSRPGMRTSISTTSGRTRRRSLRRRPRCRSVSAQRAYIAAFFDLHLGRKPTRLFDASDDHFPEVSLIP